MGRSVTHPLLNIREKPTLFQNLRAILRADFLTFWRFLDFDLRADVVKKYGMKKLIIIISCFFLTLSFVNDSYAAKRVPIPKKFTEFFSDLFSKSGRAIKGKTCEYFNIFCDDINNEEVAEKNCKITEEKEEGKKEDCEEKISDPLPNQIPKIEIFKEWNKTIIILVLLIFSKVS